MNKILQRFFEPSTYAGLAAMTLGFGDVFKAKEAPVIADAVNQVGAVVSSMPTWQGLVMGLLGAAAVFMKEKGTG